jgi:DNA repair exonuclease SbcCD nuclease subunit
VAGAARRRRDALQDTLRNIVELTKSAGAQALLCGGDLYEHERVSPDTKEFLRNILQELHPIPVLLAPGNHDWYGPQSLYRRVEWSDNVHVFDSSRLAPFELEDGLTVWGAAHCMPAGTPNLLADWRVDRGGVNLALFHGSERSALLEQGDGKMPHAPFDAEDIVRAGLQHAFLGHYHSPRDAATHTYPGNADPLAFGETGERGAVLVEVAPDGSITRERRRVATTTVHDFVIDVSGCASRQDVRARAAEVTAGLAGIARLTLAGELAQEVDLVPGDLAGIAPGLDAVAVRIGDLRLGYDLQAIQREPTVRGQFVRDLLETEMPEDERRRVLVTGLRALDGRGDLEVL